MTKKQTISKLEFAILLTFPIQTTYNFISLNNTLKTARINAYLSVIYATIIGLISIYIFTKIFNYKPDLSLPKKNIYIFGKRIGTIINYILITNITITELIILDSITKFIKIHYLKETPIIIILLAIGLTITYNSVKGIKIISRTSLIFFIIIISLTICSTIGLITKFELENIFPILEYGIKKPLLSGNQIILESILSIFILLIIPKNNIKDNKTATKYIIIFYIISMIQIFILTLLIIGILSNSLINIYNHQEYIILKKISIFGFIDRIENIVYLKWIFNSFITIILTQYYIVNTINNKKNNLTTIISITTIILIILLLKNNIIINKYILSNYHYINITSLIIYITIYLNVMYKTKNKKEAY